MVQKLGCITRVWRLTENEEGSLNLMKKKRLVVTLSLLLVLSISSPAFATAPIDLESIATETIQITSVSDEYGAQLQPSEI